MKSIKKTIYFHREKEDNNEIYCDMQDNGFKTDNIFYLGYEVEMEIELFEDGTNKVLSINGKNVSQLNISI